MKCKRIVCLFVVSLFLSNCAVLKNAHQKSKYMEVSGGGYLLKKSRQIEESYGITIEFQSLPKEVKYAIVDFEIPSNQGIYEQKIYKIDEKQTSIVVNSDPIYGVKSGSYYIKVRLSEDKNGKKIIDSLTQSVMIRGSVSKGRDYGTEYKLFLDEKEVEKIIVVYPHNRQTNNLIAGELPTEYKMAHAKISSKASIVEYVPNGENILDWTKIFTLRENPYVNDALNKPHVQMIGLGNALHKELSESDKDFMITYSAIVDGDLITVQEPGFLEKVSSAKQFTVYVDYYDNESDRSKNEREFLVAKAVKSDISIWEFQCTVRYDVNWPKKKIESLKREAQLVVNNFSYYKSNPIDKIKELLEGENADNITVEIQRLDDRSLNKKFKDVGDSIYLN